jgi:PAS domain S-box-containing protein
MTTKGTRKQPAVKPAGTGNAAPERAKRRPAGTGAGTIAKQIAAVIRLIPDAAMVIDAKGRVMAWNPAMEELTGVRAKEILGKGDYAYALPFYGERRPVLADIALRQTGDLREKYRSITPWGNTLVAEARVTGLPRGPATVYGSATILKNSRGTVIGVLELVCEVRK